ncbi:MAG: 16S rRNA (cytidine(1402)-2'-O)-methyltransferase [Halanaerobiaceae bacterium]
MSGKLYICGTPLGNLRDFTFRAVDKLREVDLIAAEDTRRTGKLLRHYDIDTRMTSLHEHNEEQKAPRLLERIQGGESIVLVSDAGMPLISDPGYKLIRTAVEAGIEIIPLPGPTAAIQALVVSGLPAGRFVFEGFLPRSGTEREERLKEIQDEKRTVIIYESPYRVKETLGDLASLPGARKMALVRELTKMHEEKLYGTASGLLEQLGEREVKGEVVLVLEGLEVETGPEGWEELTIVEHVCLLMDRGMTKKKAIKKVAGERDISRSEVYKEATVIDARNYD